MESVARDTAERITALLTGAPYHLHNYAQVVDFAAYLVNIPEYRAAHLNDLTPAEQQTVLERLTNTSDPHALKNEWLTGRTAQRQALTTAQVIEEGNAWLR